MSIELGIGIKRNTVKTNGTESLKDSADSNNNYESGKDIAVRLDGTQFIAAIKYNFLKK